jgi:histidinol-phosphate phosphatase family protein
MNSNNQVAILAGGYGTRLKDRSGSIPKSMVKILGKPVLEHQLCLCLSFGFTKIALLVHYEASLIKEYFGNGTDFGVELTYITDGEARGTAGALFNALPFLDTRFLVLYGDTYVDVDLSKFWKFDAEFPSAGSIFVHPNDHPYDSDLIEMGYEGFVARVHPYPHQNEHQFPNLVNAALYILEKESINQVVSPDVKLDLAKDAFPELLARGKKIRAYISPEYIKDMGTPERLDKVEKDILAGLPERLSNRGLRTAVFFDRDGTLNVEVDHLRSPNQLILEDGAAESVARLNRSGILAIGVTNQPVIARGDITKEQMISISAKLDSLLGERGAYLDRLYICPHHPDKGFIGEVAALKIKCLCRKPETGLIDHAVRELNISRRDSWIIGDSTTDILAGVRAGLRTILVRTGYAGRDFKCNVEPNFIADNLQDAVDWILWGHASASHKLLSAVAASQNERLVLVGGASRSGKSTVANLLVELYGLIGKKAHVLSLDCWLKSPNERVEGEGVLLRYNMNTVISEIMRVASAVNRVGILCPQFDRKTKQSLNSKAITIDPKDILIVEGVPALMDLGLVKNSKLRIYVSIDDKKRYSRIKSEYAWRGEAEKSILEKISSREIDEVSVVKRFADNANFFIEF